MITEQLGNTTKVPVTNGSSTDLHQLSFLEDIVDLKMSSDNSESMVVTTLNLMMVVTCSGSITISTERSSLNLLVQEHLAQEVLSMTRLLAQVLLQLHCQQLSLRIKCKFLSIPCNLAIMLILKTNMKIDGNSKSKATKIR